MVGVVVGLFGLVYKRFVFLVLGHFNQYCILTVLRVFNNVSEFSYFTSREGELNYSIVPCHPHSLAVGTAP
jgi:hypothetical protein